jgi:hypothetical protein
LWILLLYVFLVWVLLGAMMVVFLHAAKTLVRSVARAAECVNQPPAHTRLPGPADVPLSVGHSAADHASAARPSSWPAPATSWSR